MIRIAICDDESNQLEMLGQVPEGRFVLRFSFVLSV